MPRKPRLHYPGALYHVISRGNNRQPIFSTEQDYNKFIEYIREVKTKIPFRLYAFSLMPNHFHLLIEVSEKPLSIIMQRILTGYTRYYNRAHRKRGHLFQGRYKAILCQKDSYLLELVRYIHLNAVRAKLVKKPEDWRWCGHIQLGSKTATQLIDEDFVLSCFSENKSRAREGYLTFISDGLGIGHQRGMYPEEKAPYLGSENFIADHVSRHEELFASLTPGAVKSRLTLQEIVNAVSVAIKLRPEIIQGNSRKKEAAKARREFVVSAHEAGHKAADIARFIKRSHAFVTRVIDGNNL